MRKKIVSLIFTFVAAILIAAISQVKTAHALVSCKLNDFRNDTLQLAPGNISAGTDLPLGSVIYRATWNDPNNNQHISCTTDNPSGEVATVALVLGIESAPLPLSAWQGSPYAGKVYTTNIPGIGIAVWYSGNAATATSPVITRSNLSLNIPAGGLNYAARAPFDISLVKIGNTPPGSYIINGTTLPTAKIYFDNLSNVSGLPVTTRTISFTGSLNVTAPTCTTPDVNVNLGKHDIDATFKNLSSTSPWMEFSLQLVNCPVFQGYYPGTNNVILQTTGGGQTIPSPTSNKVGVKFSPQTEIVNPSQGLFRITKESTSAEGVAIQLAKVNQGNKEPINFLSEYQYDITPSNGSTFTIPLAARYMRTDTVIKPGLANGKVIFTINYY
ncbi:fimbrial protein [Enterobacter bugandensis]|uniref:fimbrial protein n=1 Tax=Enterobacter bugandensis TaxID=881260 RepID=UPI002D7887B3|nr:fimbrial protein [Enterobacter bugandensis]WRT53967.1 fimbrial protein [Enterobacter bugandensis]